MADTPENSDIGPGDGVSQDDIDALINAATDDEAADREGSGSASQDDIEASASSGTNLSDSADAEDGRVVPSAIDDPLRDSSEASPIGPESSTDDVGLGDGLLSQAGIDAALADAEEGPPTSAEPIAAADAQSGEVNLDATGRPFDAAADQMAAVIANDNAAAGPAASVELVGDPLDLPSFGDDLLVEGLNNEIDLLHDVNLRVKIELGRTRMLVEDVLRLGGGSVVELDKLAGDPVDVYANDRLIARGEVLVLNDNFCVRVSEIVSGEPEAVVEE